MRHFLLLFTFLILAAAPVLGQDRDDHDDRYEERRSRLGLSFTTFRVSLVPGLSSNGVDAHNVASRYSWNILAGYNGALEGGGFELGGLLNINKYYAHGAQIAGLANISGQETNGGQLAGLLNYAGGDMHGIQISGLANYSGGDVQGIQISGLLNMGEADMQGIQLAGLANLSGSEMQGMQFSGLANWAGGDAQGIQASGIVNKAGDMQGMFFTGVANVSDGEMQGIMGSGVVNVARHMQGIAWSGVLNFSESMQGIGVSTVNIHSDFQGIQSGVVNIIDRGQGIQVGVVNFGRDFEGVPVGLISYYENGRRNVDVWTSDGGFTNFGVKLGTEEVYNMISVGVNPLIDRDVWQVGWSIGHKREYRNYFTYNDFSWFHINEGDWTEDLNSIFKYRVLFGRELGNGVQLYGGPTLNMMVSRTGGSDDYTWYHIHRFGAKGREYTFWVGYALGLELF